MNYSNYDSASTSHSLQPAAQGSRDARPIPSIADPFPTTPLEAAREYVRQGMVVVPQRSPGGEYKGKEPTITGYKELRREDMSEDFLREHFSTMSNIGLLLQDDHVIIDLDSKHDQGKSARDWYQEHPDLHPFPLEQTGNGLHIHIRCQDVPRGFKTKKSPASVRLESQDGREVGAELFLSGMKVTVAPSRHENGTEYRWEKGGQLPIVPWEDVRRIIEFTNNDTKGTPGRKSRTRKGSFSGDLKAMDAVALFQEAGLHGKLIDKVAGKHSVKCPFAHEHSDRGKDWSPKDTSSVIFEGREDKPPAFKCLHAHCGERHLAEAAAEVERVHPGITARHTKAPAKPSIQLPGRGRTQSDFASEIAEAISPSGRYFLQGEALVEVRDPSPREGRLPHISITEVTATKAITGFEEFADFGRLKDEGFKKESPRKGDMEVVLVSRQIKDGLPTLVAAVAIPIPTLHDGKLVYPAPGYNPGKGLYLSKSAVQPMAMGLHEAIEEINLLLGNRDGGGFCWRSDQDKVNAIARLITPYCRGLTGWARVPVFAITGNQPRIGKDQFANLVSRLYTGRDCTGAPLDKGNDAEMRKRITSSLKSGALFIHFANMKGHVNFPSLESATDGSTTFTDRELGSTRTLELGNTAEYSLSMNVGTTLTQDLQGRAVMIQLFYIGESPNGRRFRIPNLGTHVETHRERILGACDALVRNWVEKGCPPGPTPFASFPEWAKTIGGILLAAGIGDPCLQEKTAEEFDDFETSAMKRLYPAAYAKHPEQLVDKTKLYELVESLGIFPFLDLSSNSGKSQLGKRLSSYDGREFAGFRMTIVKSDPNRIKYVFSKVEGAVTVGGAQTLQTLQTSETPFHAEEPSAGWLDEEPRPTLAADDTRPEVCNVCTGWRLIETPAELEGFIEELGRGGIGSIAINLETFEPGARGGLDPRQGSIRLIQLGLPDADPVVIDCKGLSDSDLRPLVERLSGFELVGHNLKFDLSFLHARFGRFQPAGLFCTCTAARLLSAGEETTRTDLGSVGRRYLGVNLRKGLDASDWSGALSREKLEYAADDVRHLLGLAEELKRELADAELKKVADVEMRLIPVVVRMEAAGCPVDREELERQMAEAVAKKNEAADHLSRIAGGGFNPNSPDQLLRAFREAGIEIPDTKEETLKDVDHPLAAWLLEFSVARKVLACLVGLKKALATGSRIHADFNPLGTSTGRFSCSNPCLQSLPRGEVRRIVAAPEGRMFVKADYSQIELRVVAAVAGERLIIQAYEEGLDLHVQTASMILDKPQVHITRKERRLAKALNFGLLYGQGAAGFAAKARREYGVSLTEDEAAFYRRRFFDSYPALEAWQESCRRSASDAQEARTLLGRRRLLPQTGSWWSRFSPLLNHPVQGSAADGLKLAMIRLDEELPPGARMVATIHDEILVEVDEAKVEEVETLVKRVMEEEMAGLLKQVPVFAEISSSRSW